MKHFFLMLLCCKNILINIKQRQIDTDDVRGDVFKLWTPDAHFSTMDSFCCQMRSSLNHLKPFTGSKSDIQSI